MALTRRTVLEDAEEIRGIEERIEALKWLYRTYRVKHRDWFTTLAIGQEEVFSFAEIIKKRREAFGWTQEQLAEGICDPVTISRIERGISKCQRMKLGRLMDKLQLPGGTAVLSVQTGRWDTYQMVAEINRLSKFARHKEAEPLFEELKRKAVHDRYVDQFLVHREATIQNAMKKMEDAMHWKQQKKALYMTLPKKEPEELEGWVFTRMEAMIINSFAHSCKKIGKVQETIVWLELLRKYYEKQSFHIHHYARGYGLTLRNLGDLLGELEEFEKAIQYDDMATRLALETGKANVLCLSVFDRGWNMIQQQEKMCCKKEESCLYIKAALIINRLYSKPVVTAQIEKYWKEHFLQEKGQESGLLR